MFCISHARTCLKNNKNKIATEGALTLLNPLTIQLGEMSVLYCDRCIEIPANNRKNGCFFSLKIYDNVMKDSGEYSILIAVWWLTDATFDLLIRNASISSANETNQWYSLNSLIYESHCCSKSLSFSLTLHFTQCMLCCANICGASIVEMKWSSLSLFLCVSAEVTFNFGCRFHLNKMLPLFSLNLLRKVKETKNE